MNHIRLGIIGLGNMGAYHADAVLNHKISRCQLTALCDTNPAALARFTAVPHFARSPDLIRSGLIDAVLIEIPRADRKRKGIRP